MNRISTRRWLLAAIFLSVVFLANAQTTVIPQIADGNGWQTQFVLTNTNVNSASVSMAFFQDVSGGGGATQSWSLPLLETSNTQNMSLVGGGTMFLTTPGTAATTSQGWAQVQADPGVVVYAIFTETVTGRQNQEGTSTALVPTPRVLIPFNNTAGLTTSVAVANSDPNAATIYVLIQTDSGTITTPSPLVIPAHGHAAFTMQTQFPATIASRGLLELYPLTGNFSALALQFNPTGAFTTAPVYPQSTETPIIGGGGYNGGGTIIYPY